MAPWPVIEMSAVSRAHYLAGMPALTSLRRLPSKDAVHVPPRPELHVRVRLSVVREPELVLLREPGLDLDRWEAFADHACGRATVARVRAVDLPEVLQVSTTLPSPNTQSIASHTIAPLHTARCTAVRVETRWHHEGITVWNLRMRSTIRGLPASRRVASLHSLHGVRLALTSQVSGGPSMSPQLLIIV